MKTLRKLAGLEVELVLPKEMYPHRNAEEALQSGLSYSGVSFSAEGTKKVSFVLDSHKLPDHLIAYSLCTKREGHGTNVFLHFYYKLNGCSSQ